MTQARSIRRPPEASSSAGAVSYQFFYRRIVHIRETLADAKGPLAEAYVIQAVDPDHIETRGKGICEHGPGQLPQAHA